MSIITCILTASKTQSDSSSDSERCDWNVTLSDHWEVHKVVHLFRPRSPSPIQIGNNWFFSFIFSSRHQIITWPSVISPVSAQDKPVSLNLQHGSPSLYQTLHFPAPFSSHSHKILPLSFTFFFSLQALIWSEKTEKKILSARLLCPTDILGQVIIHHDDSFLSGQYKDSC